MAGNFSAGLLFLLLVAPLAVYGATFNVDWSLTGDYSSWANKAVEVGDSIVFTYSGTHSVDVVSKDQYASCDASSPSFTDNTGKTTYKLTKAGAVYFICGTAGHCPPMKLQLNVKAASGSTSPSTSPSSTTPSTSTSTPSSSTPATTTTTTGSKSGATAHGLSWIVFGVSAVFGFAFMG